MSTHTNAYLIHLLLNINKAVLTPKFVENVRWLNVTFHLHILFMVNSSVADYSIKLKLTLKKQKKKTF